MQSQATGELVKIRNRKGPAEDSSVKGSCKSTRKDLGGDYVHNLLRAAAEAVSDNKARRA